MAVAVAVAEAVVEAVVAAVAMSLLPTPLSLPASSAVASSGYVVSFALKSPTCRGRVGGTYPVIRVGGNHVHVAAHEGHDLGVVRPLVGHDEVASALHVAHVLNVEGATVL